MPGCRESVVDGVTGIIVPPRVPETLAGALRSLVDDPERAAAMGEAGLKLAWERFDQGAIFGTLFDLYEGRLMPDGRPA
jgi:glycosyltransferase involved in cell wall biosynthesis